MAQIFSVELDYFVGPIDLLLHLVKSNELEIEKLSLAQVAEQYMSCLDKIKNLDLEVAGEYLVVAATLLSIKSSVLLNQPVELVQDEEGNLFDPHQDLLNKLREAEIYKMGAKELENRDILGVDVFATHSRLNEVGEPEFKFKEHDPLLLGMAFRKMLDKLSQEKREYTVVIDRVSIVDRMKGVILKLKSGSGFKFDELVTNKQSKIEIVGVFLALLELCKRQVIFVKQDQCFNEITISLAEGDLEFTNFESEYDVKEVVNG